MSIIEKIFKREEPAPQAEEVTPEQTAEEAPQAEEVTPEQSAEEAPQVEEVTPEQSAEETLRAEYEAKLKELECMKATLEAEKLEAMKRAEEAEKGLAEQKANDAIARAVADGRLTPSQVGDGSVFVRLAHENPTLFAEIVDQLNAAEFPVEAKLTSKENLEAPQKTLKELVASGMDPMRALDEVTR